MHVYNELIRHLKSRQVTRVERSAGARTYTDGFVVGLSDQLVAMASIIDFRSDGVELFPLRHVDKVVNSSADGFWQNVLEQEGLVPGRGCLRKLQIGDYHALAESLLASGRMIGVSWRPDPDHGTNYAVGVLRAVDDTKLAIQRIWGSGLWDDEWTWVRYENIERVDVNRPYVNTYERYAGAPDPDDARED